MTTSPLLSNEEETRILAALRSALSQGPATAIDATKIFVRGDNRVIPVVPLKYPEDKWAFLSGLAEAEIGLRDSGMRVRLDPYYPQRMLVVAKVNSRTESAYETVAGRELRDLAALLRIDEGDLDQVDLDAYAYDSADDLALVVEEARQEHPDADFSYVRLPSSASLDAHSQ